MTIPVSALAVLGVRRRVPEIYIYRPSFAAGSRHIEEPRGMPNGEASRLRRRPAGQQKNCRDKHCERENLAKLYHGEPAKTIRYPISAKTRQNGPFEFEKGELRPQSCPVLCALT